MTEARWVGLDDVEEAHRRAPRTFSIPRSDQRSALKVGDMVKLVFLADRPSSEGHTAERMWVEVTEVGDGTYVGALDNQPTFLSGLNPGDSVTFEARHVAAQWRSPSGLDVPYQQTARVSRAVVEAERWPAWAERTPTADSSWSGWTILAEGEVTSGADLLSLRVDELVRRFRILDSVLDEPYGTRWRWDSERLEYVQVG